MTDGQLGDEVEDGDLEDDHRGGILGEGAVCEVLVLVLAEHHRGVDVARGVGRGERGGERRGLADGDGARPVVRRERWRKSTKSQSGERTSQCAKRREARGHTSQTTG